MINRFPMVNRTDLETVATTDVLPGELPPKTRLGPGVVFHPQPFPHPGPLGPPTPVPAPTPTPVQPAPPTSPTPAPVVPPVVPPAPQSSPFDSLPFPSPGDRIKSDDFKKLSQALKIISDMAKLSGSLVGHTFGDVKGSLVSQGYQIFRVMSVFGAEIGDLADPSLDSRKVIQVMPVDLGGKGVLVVVTEAVDTRRFVPNLMGLTYREAQERVHALIGDALPGGPPPTAPQLVGLRLDQAQQAMNR